MADILRCGLSLARSLSSQPKLLKAWGDTDHGWKWASRRQVRRSSALPSGKLAGPQVRLRRVQRNGTKQNRTRGQQGMGGDGVSLQLREDHLLIGGESVRAAELNCESWDEMEEEMEEEMMGLPW